MTTTLEHNTDVPHLATGIRRLLDEFAKVQSNDFVLIAYTPDSRIYSAHLAVTLRQAGIRHVAVVMTPLIDPGFHGRLELVLPDPQSFSGNLVVLTLEKDTMSHFDVLTPLFRLYGVARTRIVRIISASDELFTHGLALTPTELEALNATLLDFLQGALRIRVQTDGGTDLNITLDQDRYEWISNRGKLRPGAFTILPAGEIATFSDAIEGRLVADGALNCNVITELDMRLADNPLFVTIRNSIATSFSCSSTSLNTFVEQAFKLPNARRIGEIGFGTNQALKTFLSHNSHLNERHPSLHIGFGQHNQSLQTVPYEADIHLDAVTQDAVITIEGTGRQLRLSELVPDPSKQHPALMRDEDITGDCCSSGCRVVRIGP
ncbi:hypothetical protein V1638_14510 [Pseudarthrobacter sp. J64]|uniref:hypothetical protein n=1 Tax=Pseudarthrobacter sp. J64 TaxID=3116485 RepID=UPI002E821D15|nr:hypothetical protein [Pseudarthrobacter sp. J64]MEE2570598.1 hypothetical protein [Pseudarthrobacter sp. J64]